MLSVRVHVWGSMSTCVSMSVSVCASVICMCPIPVLYSCCIPMYVHVNQCLCICTRVCLCNYVCTPVPTPGCMLNPQTFTKHPIKSLHFRLKQTSLSLRVTSLVFLLLYLFINQAQSLGFTTYFFLQFHHLLFVALASVVVFLY